MQAKTCLLANHQYKDIEYVCTHPNCQISRFLCSQCVNFGNHSHDNRTNSYILDKEQLYVLLMQANKQEQVRKSKIDQFKQLAFEIEQQSFKIEDGTNQLINNQYLQQELLKENQNIVYQLDEQLLNNTLQMLNKQQYDIQITQQLNNIRLLKSQRVKEWAQTIYYDFFSIRPVNDLKFQNFTLDRPNSKNILSAAISNNLKYIISGTTDRTFKIWDYDSLQLIQMIHTESGVGYCVFTTDSILLYIGDYPSQINMMLKTNSSYYIVKKYIIG